jgi:hypothetical protein
MDIKLIMASKSVQLFVTDVWMAINSSETALDHVWLVDSGVERNQSVRVRSDNCRIQKKSSITYNQLKFCNGISVQGYRYV